MDTQNLSLIQQPIFAQQQEMLFHPLSLTVSSQSVAFQDPIKEVKMEMIPQDNHLEEHLTQMILTILTMTTDPQVEDPLEDHPADPLEDPQEDHLTIITPGYPVCLKDLMEPPEEEEDPLVEDHREEAHQEDHSLKIPLQIDNPPTPKVQMMGLNLRKRSKYPTYPNGMVMAILYWIGLIS